MPLSPETLDAWLPQTQCTQCGYPRCRAYAEALADGSADINRCPPGGEVTIAALARLLGKAAKPLDPQCGTRQPRQRAVIDEQTCIGCRKCIDVCPVDAILGARKLMHTVLAAECSGCALCLPACPVDCIALVPASAPPDAASPWPEYARRETERWRARTMARLVRLQRRKEARAAARGVAAEQASGERERIRAEIRAAVARVKAKKVKPNDTSA